MKSRRSDRQNEHSDQYKNTSSKTKKNIVTEKTKN